MFVSNTPPGHNVSSLQTLGRPCPDSRTNTWKLLAFPRKAIPVGIFRPETNTDALNPAGRLMDGGNCGLKNAVLAMHCGEVEGFATVAAWATIGSAKSGANAHAAVRACKRLSSITEPSSLFPLLKARAKFCRFAEITWCFFGRWVTDRAA